MITRIDPRLILLAALKGERIPPGRYMDITYCRFILARHLRLQRKNQEEIGAEMNRDRSTVASMTRSICIILNSANLRIGLI